MNIHNQDNPSPHFCSFKSPRKFIILEFQIDKMKPNFKTTCLAEVYIGSPCRELLMGFNHFCSNTSLYIFSQRHFSLITISPLLLSLPISF